MKKKKKVTLDLKHRQLHTYVPSTLNNKMVNSHVTFFFLQWREVLKYASLEFSGSCAPICHQNQDKI